MAILNIERCFGWYSCLVIGCLAFGQQALSHEHSKMCSGIKDGDGEPVVQSDGDIVLHAGSAPCPDEPETTDKPSITKPDPVTATIYFDFDVAEPNSDGQAMLMSLMQAISMGMPSRISIAGHADRAGSEAYNLDLSNQRAGNVADALIEAGAPSLAISTEALGESDPAVPTEDGVREAANRRAEVEILF